MCCRASRKQQIIARRIVDTERTMILYAIAGALSLPGLKARRRQYFIDRTGHRVKRSGEITARRGREAFGARQHRVRAMLLAIIAPGVFGVCLGLATGQARFGGVLASTSNARSVCAVAQQFSSPRTTPTFNLQYCGMERSV